MNIPHVQEIEEDFKDADDSITELFKDLIDPEGRTSDPITSDFRSGPRPDTSKFRLEGLKKFKPRSFDESSPRSEGHYGRGHYVSDLSPTVEIDGLDYAGTKRCCLCYCNTFCILNILQVFEKYLNFDLFKQITIYILFVLQLVHVLRFRF